MKRIRPTDLIRTILAVSSLAAISAFAPAGADARPADVNHDRLPDRWEVRHHLTLKVKQTFRNQDHDELFNLFELRAGTNPRKADTDGDGIRDGLENPDGDTLANGEEQYLHLNPRKADTDGNGIEDGADDSDGDGVSNHDEFVAGTDPLSACEGDDHLGFELHQERRMRIQFRSVRSWFTVADYFDGTVDSDCDSGEDETADEDGSDGDDGDGEPIELLFDASDEDGAGDGSH